MLEQLINQNKAFKTFTRVSPWTSRHQGMLYACLWALLHKYLWIMPEKSSGIDPILTERIDYLAKHYVEAKRLTAYTDWLNSMRNAYNSNKLTEKYYPFHYRKSKFIMEK